MTRPKLLKRIGIAIHPEAITIAWYEADCPPQFAARGVVSRSTYLRWRLACLLRGVNR